jgi:hypothetical protein
VTRNAPTTSGTTTTAKISHGITAKEPSVAGSR